MNQFTINILGCGSAKPSTRHYPSCTVLNVRENLYMVDCGEGAQMQMQRQKLRFNRLNHIFLTHLHGDHVFGLPGLLSTLSLLKREGTVTIHTFVDGRRVLRDIIRYFSPILTYDLVFNEISPGTDLIYEDRHITVRTIPLKHRLPCVGYIFEEKQKPRHLIGQMADFHQVPIAVRKDIIQGADFIKSDGTVIPNSMLTTAPSHSASYAHIGDTSFIPKMADKIGPVDLLYHESTYLTADLHDAAGRGHSTAAQAATMAEMCGAGQLLLGHYSSRYKDLSLFLNEAREIFPNTILGFEGMRVPLI